MKSTKELALDPVKFTWNPDASAVIGTSIDDRACAVICIALEAVAMYITPARRLCIAHHVWFTLRVSLRRARNCLRYSPSLHLF